MNKTMKNPPKKMFFKDGHWIQKPFKTIYLECSCGNKYIKTREKQTMCIRCMGRPENQ